MPVPHEKRVSEGMVVGGAACRSATPGTADPRSSPVASTVRTVISPGRYVQGKGAIHQLGDYLAPLGSKPLIVADDLVWGFVGHDVEASLAKAGLPVRREKFNGIPSAKEVDRLVEVIKETGSDVAIAVGGGSTIDAVT